VTGTTRKATQEALVAPSGEWPPWRELPSWFVIGEEDRIIRAELQHFMAERARAQRTLEIPGASHAALVSQPQATADLTWKPPRCPWPPEPATALRPKLSMELRGGSTEHVL
jgi:Alpha/beta hydrolase family